MREADRGDGSPPQAFLDEGTDVRQGVLVREVGQAVRADDVVQFGLGFLLNLRERRHCEEERLHGRERL